MKPKTMILMVVAVVCGLAASYMTSRLLAERTGPEDLKKITILVARKNLERGAGIKSPQDMFQEKSVTEENAPQGFIASFDELKGRVLQRSLRKDDFVTAADLLNEKDTIMDNMLANGYQAVGIRVNVESIAGGFASLPLSRVDIYATVRRSDDKNSFTKLLLQNVLVLAADTHINRPDEGKAAIVATTVTVALKPEDILKVNLVKEFGPLSLALRKFGDTQKSELPKFSLEEFLGDGKGAKETTEIAEVLPKAPLEKPLVVAPPVPDAPKTRIHKTWVTNGDKQDLVEFTLDENDEVVSHRVLQSRESRVETPAVIGPTPPAPKQGTNP
jgi:Flp pilus assembly protein CpaB